jgi:hypothetical protein
MGDRENHWNIMSREASVRIRADALGPALERARLSAGGAK